MRNSKSVLLNKNITLNELLNEYEKLVRNYEKLLNDIVKITKISDIQSKNLYEAKLKLTQLNEELKIASETDNLTKLYNRSIFDEIINTEIERFNRYGRNLSIIMCDIDFFKKINDNFGHNLGDKVLITIANIFRNNLRKTDWIIRWGGEEFLIILPETNKQNAYEIAEKLRKLIENCTEIENVRFTASFGVAEYMPNLSVDKFIDSADKKLYKSKQKGRNKVSV